MLHNNKQFIIHFWAYRPRLLFCKFFLIEPQIDHFHVELGYFKPTRILSLLKINFFFNKTYEPNFSLPRDLANQFLEFHANRELTSLQAYRRKKFALLANFFRWQFYSCKVLRS